MVILAFVALVGATVLVGVAFKDGITFFRSPSQILAEAPSEAEVFRLGGLVEVGSLQRDGSTVRFVVTDGGASVAAEYTGILPDLFKEGQGMVGTGRYINGVFQASEILAKHDENYMPKEVIEALKEQGTFQDPGS